MTASPDELVDRAVARLGTELTVAAPLGLGKPVNLLNAFYDRAVERDELDLTIVTALSLMRPEPSSELERRLVEPLSDRIFGDYPVIHYARDRRRGDLPDNVSVREFYFSPGGELGNPRSQQDYVSSNYTHVVRDILSQGINVVAQLVTPACTVDGKEAPVHSMSCNADLTLDLLDALSERDAEYMLLGETNANLPFMHGDSYLRNSWFDGLYEPETDHDLFGPPSQPLDEVDYAIGLHASQLVVDGGTLQVGIGTLSEALSRMLILRNAQNDAYRDLVERFPTAPPPQEKLVDRIGDRGPFEVGLYGGTEMFVRGFEELYREGILSRKVYDHPILQEYVNDRDGDDTVGWSLVERLLDRGVIQANLTPRGLRFLRTYGIVRDEVTMIGGELFLPNGENVEADLRNDEVRDRFREEGLGESLEGGAVAHAGFFLGPPSLYEFLRNLDEDQRRTIRMSRISFVNELYGDESLKRTQRRNARFLNSAMKVTATGAVVSDGLENGQVVSGVGGQYNFVAMAHELEDGRSVIMLPSTRTSGGEVESNVVWNYGHTTIPRHLRDVVVTEYGAVDLRGKSDREVIEAMLSVADARFQDDVAEKAREAGKLPGDWTIPDSFRENRPGRVKDWLESAREAVDLPSFPFGTELTDEEVTLARALRKLKSKYETGDLSLRDLGVAWRSLSGGEELEPYLERMDLGSPDSLKEHALRRLLTFALRLDGVSRENG